jgi:phosphatidylglycerophosphatase A
MQKPNLRDPLQLLAVGLGSGLAPKAPGTSGSLASLVFFPFLAMLTLPVYLVVVAIASIIGIKFCAHAAEALGVHDDGRIVWDEFCGQWLALAPLVPIVHWRGVDLLWVLAGFVLFRVLDIIKPWPISWLDKKVHGGLGIMIDDIVAGALAAAILWFVQIGFVRGFFLS